MKYSCIIILLLLTSTAQASYCSGKNWQDAYQFYTDNIDVLNVHIDRYNKLLNQTNTTESNHDQQQQYVRVAYAIAELDKLSTDVEELGRKFVRIKGLWQLISEHCLNDDELDYNNKAIENIRGANIGRKEVNDLLARIESLRLYFFQVVERNNY